MEKYRYKWFALIGISILAFTAFLDFTIVNTALPFIQKDFKTTVINLQWVANVFAIVLSMTMIVVGKFGDLWGRKKVFYFGVVIFALAALGAGLSPTIGTLIFFRGLQGLGASILFITAAALVSDAFPKTEQPRAVGIYSGITGVGLMLGPFLGGMLISLGDWRWVFWVNLPLIIAGFIFCIFSLKRVTPATHKVKIDWISLLLLTSGLGFFIYGIVQKSWILILGLAALVTLFMVDVKKDKPLLSIRTIVKDKLIFLSLLSCAAAGVVSYVFMFFDPLYLENVRGLSAFSIGLMVAIIPAAQVVISFVFEPLLKILGMVNIFFISLVGALLGVGLHLTIGESTPFVWMLVPFFLLGIPWGLSNAGMVTAVNQRVSGSQTGETIGTIATTWNVIGAIFLSISSVVFQMYQGSFVEGFHKMTMVNFAFILIVLIFAWCIRKSIQGSATKR